MSHGDTNNIKPSIAPESYPSFPECALALIFHVNDALDSTSGYYLLLLSRFIDAGGTASAAMIATAYGAVDVLGLLRDSRDDLFRPRNWQVPNFPNEPTTVRYLQNNQDVVQGLMMAQSIFRSLSVQSGVSASEAARARQYAETCRDWATRAQRSFAEFYRTGDNSYDTALFRLPSGTVIRQGDPTVWYQQGAVVGSGLTNIQMVASGQVANRAALFAAVDNGVDPHNPVGIGDKPDGSQQPVEDGDGVPWLFSNQGVERWVLATAELGDPVLHSQYMTQLRNTVDTALWDPSKVYGFRFGLALMALTDAKSALPDMINATPTFTLSTSTATLPENTATTTRIKMADLSVTDDLLGSVTWSLSGPQLAAFEVDAGALYLRAGATLDFEVTPTLSVTVEANDPNTGGPIDDSKTFTLTLQDVNAAPQLRYDPTLTKVRTSLDTTRPHEIGRVTILDDGEGANPLSLVGPAAASFELAGGILRLKAGVVLDPVAPPSLVVTVRVDDPAIPGGPESSVVVTLNVVRDAFRQFIPLYSFPQFTDGTRTQLAGWWRSIVDTASATDPVLVVINPQNGTANPAAGSGSDYGVYLDAIRLLRANPHVQILGYVYSQFGGRPEAEIRQNLDWYDQFYKAAGGASLIDGIFVDEMSSNASTLSYYESLASYIRSRTGLNGRYILANPGTVPASTLLSTSVANGVVIYENVEAPTGPGDLQLRDLAVPTVDGGALDYAVIVHGAPVASDRDRIIRSTKLKGVDYVYVTNDTLVPNPFDNPPVYAASTPPEFHRPYAADTTISIAENRANGTAVAAVAGRDMDFGQSLTYAITGGNSGGAFAIHPSSGTVTVADMSKLDFETTTTWTLTIAMTDTGTTPLIGTSSLVVSLTNENESPTALVLSNTSISENVPIGTAIGAFTTTDPDAANTFIYSLATGSGSVGNGSFTIVGNELRTNAAMNFEAQWSYPIRVRTTDQGGLFFEQTFTITVTNVNESPTALALS